LRRSGFPRAARAPVIDDLDGNGSPEVITAAGIHIYAWTPPASRWRASRVLEPSLHGPALESDSSHPKCGFRDPGDRPPRRLRQAPDVVEPSLDGHLYAWRANGEPVPGYLIALIDPAEVAAGEHRGRVDQRAGDRRSDGAGHDDVSRRQRRVYGPRSKESASPGSPRPPPARAVACTRSTAHRQNHARLAGGDAGLDPGSAALIGPGRTSRSLGSAGKPWIVA
jgi:hypothetical protein